MTAVLFKSIEENKKAKLGKSHRAQNKRKKEEKER